MKNVIKSTIKNTINPKKLHLSKWTAVNPTNKEKHFIVTKLEYDEDNNEVLACIIEAVLSHREERIQWQVLKDKAVWLPGWK